MFKHDRVAIREIALAEEILQRTNMMATMIPQMKQNDQVQYYTK